MSTYVRSEDLVECKVCYAVLTYGGRPTHMAWHANQRAKIFTLQEQLKEFERWLTSKEFEK